MTDLTARNAITNAGFASLILAVAALGFTVYGASGPGGFKDFYGGSVSVWNVADVLITIAIAIGIFRRSRFAAILMLIYYIYGRIHAWFMDVPFNFLTIVVTIGFTYVFVQGARATFLLHGKTE